MFPRRTAHALHFIMSLLSGGLWIPIWILCYMVNRNHNDRLQQMMFMNQQGNNRKW